MLSPRNGVSVDCCGCKCFETMLLKHLLPPCDKLLIYRAEGVNTGVVCEACLTSEINYDTLLFSVCIFSSSIPLLKTKGLTNTNARRKPFLHCTKETVSRMEDVVDDFPVYDDMYEGDDFEMYDDMQWVDMEVPQEIHMTFAELKEHCVMPTVLNTAPQIGKLLLCCFVVKFTNSLVELPPSVVHLTSITTGLFALHLFAENKIAPIIIMCCLGYGILFTVHQTLKRHYGAFTATVTILFLVICEVVIVERKDWHVIRGIEMVLTMKLISLGFDLDSGLVPNFPYPMEYGGYCLCVGTLIFGPWISFNEYMKLLHRSKFTLKWIMKIIISAVLCTVFLLMSTCFAHWIIPDHAHKWLLAFRDAFSFRSSHYFVGFISEVTAVCAGLGAASSGWEFSVTRPQHIELPRSLTEVVIYWNMPMHQWLKKYIFKTFRPLNKFTAIISTYATSSLLHGLNFQLAAVLLSLGLYTYTEYEFRQKLSNIFKACIQARRCKEDCLHTYKASNPAVLAANIAFSFLAVFHLAYLGVMFDSSNQQEQGYSMEHTLSKWSDLNYASHWVAFGTFIVHYLI